MKKLKLFPKIFIYTISLLLFILLLAHSLLYYLLPAIYMNEKNKEIAERSSAIVETLEHLTENEADIYLEEYAIRYNVNITLQTATGSKRYKGFTPLDIYFEPALPSFEDFPEDSESGFSGNETPQIIIDQQDFTFVNQAEATLLLIVNIQPIDEAKQIALKILPYSLLLSFIVALVSAYLFSSSLTRPIRKMVDVTKRMENLEKNQYYEVTTEDEIGMLGENINMLYDTLWHTIHSLETKVEEISRTEKQKIEFLWAASHELKTPLTSLSIILENMKYNIGKYADRDYYLGEAEKKVQESTTLVQNILYTTKLQTDFEMDHTQVCQLDDILRQTLFDYDILAKAKQLRLIVDIEEDIFVSMNKEALEKVCSNIIANAIQHTNEGKNVWVTLNQNVFVVKNENSPLSDEELQKIFEPFYRPDFSRNKKDGGTGLGLHIVKDILTYANLPFTLENGTRGVKFSIDLTNRIEN